MAHYERHGVTPNSLRGGIVEQSGHMEQLVAAALRDCGFHVSDGGGGLQLIGVPGGSVATLRTKGGFWLVDIPQPAGAPPVIRALGRTTVTLAQVTDAVRAALAANWPDQYLPAALAGRSTREPEGLPRAPVADVVAVEVLERLRPVLTGGAGLSGPVREQFFGTGPCLVIGSAYGQIVVRVTGDRVVVDSHDPDGAPARFVVGVVGRPEGPTARRAVAAARTLTGATLRRGLSANPFDMATLNGLLKHLAGYSATGDDGVPVVVVPSTGTHRGVTLFTFARVVIADGPDGLDVFGAFGSQSPTEIADEVTARLTLSADEQQRAADAWMQHGPELIDRLARLTAAVQAGDDTGATRHLVAALDAARDQVHALRDRGGIPALVEADGIVGEVQSALTGAGSDMTGPPPAPRLIRQWADAEVCAAEWMEWFGLGAARLTGGSADGGVDVECDRAVGQIKDYGSPLPAGPVREVFAVASLAGKLPVIFARAGFTVDAVGWGELAGVAMFTFDLQGTPEPVSSVARDLMGRGA